MTLLIPAERVREQIASILTAWGMEADAVATAAEVMVDTDLAGVDSHGISMLMMYEGAKSSGQLQVKARPRVVRENAVTGLVDGGAGLGHPAAVTAMRMAMAKARAAGVGMVAVTNSYHFGAAGYYAALAARDGLIGVATTTTRSLSVVPTGGTTQVLGTNPIAFAAPAKRNRPFVLDMSTSTVAVNKVRMYELKKKPLPPGWVIDDQGGALTDSTQAFDYLVRRHLGGLTPLGGAVETGGHKGYGLAVMVQILSATLSGSAFSPVRNQTQRPGDPDNIGHFFMAIDPTAFRPEGGFEDDLDAMIDWLHGISPIDPAQPVMVAGEPEAASREKRGREGIPIEPALAEKIRGICARCGAAFVLTG